MFLPSALLGQVAPWKATDLYPQLPPWNPLRWDGIGQFYPWRKFAAETLRSGILPLWNPYQFCGTPFVANSQSAVFYPGNLLFTLIPDTAYAFGWSAVLHLTLCGWFAYLLLRHLRCSELASLLGGVVYAYSAWQAAWLQLPTFLATSCWFPLVLRQICRYGVRTSRKGNGRPALDRAEYSILLSGLWGACCIGAPVGMMLLAGHLQIALYGLMAAAALASGMLVTRRSSMSQIPIWALGLLLGLLLAMPQLIPSFELSRVSHRVGKPTDAGYRAYVDYSLPPSGIVQTLLPDISGGDSDVANPYWAYYRLRLPDGQIVGVTHNPAETAMYVGIVPLVLSLFVCIRGLKQKPSSRAVLYFALLALVALLLALGTPLNALLYYGLPGFAQSGSPARCLVLWSLAISALAAYGLDEFDNRPVTRRELAWVLGIVAAILVVGLNLTADTLASPPPGYRQLPLLGEVFGRIVIDWIRLGIFLVSGIVLLCWKRLSAMGRTMRPQSAFNVAQPAAIALVVLDLFWAHIGSNPTARRDQVYPDTTGIAYLRDHVGHDRIFPINQRWSLFAAQPFSLPDVLPPNAATVYGLRDVQGYDSLFSGRYKAYANRFARPNRMGLLDASPIEVGNMVFFQNANAPGVSDTAAAFAIAIPYDKPGFPADAVPHVTPVDAGDPGMMVYTLPAQQGRARLKPMTSNSSMGWLEDGPTRVGLALTTPVRAEFSLMDAAMPGWRLSIDGRPAAIRVSVSEPVGRYTRISPGRHTIAYRYEPASFRIGLYAGCAAVFVFGFSASLRRAVKSSLNRAS